jgi:hypothetical protein
VAKIKEYNPKIAVFNGKGIYEVFSGQKEFIFGKQPDKITDTETVSGEKLKAIVVEPDITGKSLKLVFEPDLSGGSLKPVLLSLI